MADLGQINRRQAKYLSTTDNSDWETHLPNENWLVIPFGDTEDIELITKVANACLDKHVNYVCTIGGASELIHDIFDEEIVNRIYVKEEPMDKSIYGDGEPMTTWYKDIEEGLWFSFNTAFADKVDIDSVIILDMTENGGLELIQEMLTKIG